MKIRIMSPTDNKLTQEWYWESMEPFIKHKPSKLVEMILSEVADRAILLFGRTENYGSNTIHIEITP